MGLAGNSLSIPCVTLTSVSVSGLYSKEVYNQHCFILFVELAGFEPWAL